MSPPSKKPGDLGDAINRTILPIDSQVVDLDATLPTPPVDPNIPTMPVRSVVDDVQESLDRISRLWR